MAGKGGCEPLPAQAPLLADRDAFAPEVVYHLLDLVHIAITYLIYIFHAIHEMESQVIVLIDLSAADVISIQPGFELGHEIVKAAGAHESSVGLL
jgi:hypothetical protein